MYSSLQPDEGERLAQSLVDLLLLRCSRLRRALRLLRLRWLRLLWRLRLRLRLRRLLRRLRRLRRGVWRADLQQRRRLRRLGGGSRRPPTGPLRARRLSIPLRPSLLLAFGAREIAGNRGAALKRLDQHIRCDQAVDRLRAKEQVVSSE